MQLRIPPWNLTTVTDVTALRAIDGTVYTNSTSKTMFVVVYVQHDVTVATGRATITATSGGSIQGQSGLFSSPVMTTLSAITFVVRPGDTYNVNGNVVNGSNIKGKWIEAY